MPQITTPEDIKKLGTILSIWAHPDDESYSCAGIMAAAVQNGQKVICVTATKGEAGVQDEARWPASRLGEIRAEEMAAALNVLGIDDHHWLNYRDGRCGDVSMSEAVGRLEALIDKYKPDTVLTFGPEGMTGHPDHQAVSAWATAAAAGKPISLYYAVELRELYESMKEADEKFNIFFNIDKPPIVEESECDILLCLDVDLLLKKYQCLCAMPSQTEAMFKHFGQEMICQMICSESFVRAK